MTPPLRVVRDYWHTIRYLKPAQIVGRLRFRLLRPRVDPAAPAPRRRQQSGRWHMGIARPPMMVAPFTFRFLNVTREIASDWDDPAIDKLWRYNLHYFDDLNARDAHARRDWHRAVLTRWVSENSPTRGSGWEPYPTSLRIVNWIKWVLAGNELSPECARSLAVQARWLSRRLETHLLGNHLFANAKALVFAGLFHDGAESDDWLDVGCRILAQQLPEQILADGGQFELSPMYHAIALEDVLDLCNVAGTFAESFPSRWASKPSEWRAVVPRMAEWLRAMTHPDGGIAFFNDAAFGIAPTDAELTAYGDRLGIHVVTSRAAGLTRLAATGYVRADAGLASLILDAAPVGPDYLPGHGHADTLSFELSLHGHRLIVNSGVSEYGRSAERQRQRGTAAHSTVVVDGQDSSEVWGAFRMARRARPKGFFAVQEGSIRVRCSHDGYQRLPGHPVHTREWTLDASRLAVTDTVTGRFASAAARFHLHPAVDVCELRTGADGGRIQLRLPDSSMTDLTVTGGVIGVEQGTWHPEFGVSTPNRCIHVTFVSPRIESIFLWTPGS